MIIEKLLYSVVNGGIDFFYMYGDSATHCSNCFKGIFQVFQKNEYSLIFCEIKIYTSII